MLRLSLCCICSVGYRVSLIKWDRQTRHSVISRKRRLSWETMHLVCVFPEKINRDFWSSFCCIHSVLEYCPQYLALWDRWLVAEIGSHLRPISNAIVNASTCQKRTIELQFSKGVKLKLPCTACWRKRIDLHAPPLMSRFVYVFGFVKKI